ncbi:hypothetical protein DDB_G0267644 [Dictyostelium discoideum AX4]|uniref:Tim44-like domain-containing protein n=1 Tax=Dictyostelium discoideum TaxID=44689 RepID=Q55GJ5_DICDI|nr:hypothetical protein DDB_G0267644 [Dictyostelium discoideum AX4]EAL73275.1 hypothetical protein DDB_G0267644 [Dictyostelium discoideum AX4]|eukprot:XP_647189.1 hypothetical protein DDB_G0267644 [Dictyostelium discoideum AX4]
MIPTKLIKNQNKFFILKRLYTTNVLKSTSICLTNNNNNNYNNKSNNIKRFYSSSNEPNKNSKDENELEKNKKENEKKKQAVDEHEEEEDDEDEEDEDDEKPSLDNKYLMPLGTDKNESILEDRNDDNPEYILLEALVKSKQYKGGYGLAANLSLAEYLHRYTPIRDTPVIPPHFFSAPLINELFQYNPFLLILPHPRVSGFAENFQWNAAILSDSKKPLYPTLDKDDFLKSSKNALKTIYRIAKEGKSMELQELSCQPGIVNLLLLRDSFYAIETGNDEFKFNANDIDIDNFDFQPITALTLESDKDFGETIKIEAFYLVTSEKYKLNQKHCPVTIKVNWVSPVDAFDWKIYDISYKTPFDLN